MTQFVFFSKSVWSEPPRLRHQIANMLRSHGHEVVFFQKPSFAFQPKGGVSEGLIESNLRLVHTQQLIHHQLRVFDALAFFNGEYEKRSIKKSAVGVVRSGAVIVNFNYDYYFLRSIFPGHKIITVINDDFVAQAKFFKGRHAENVLARTSRMSDAVLTVSYPLIEQLSAWCKPILFLPWADSEYKAPNVDGLKDSVLLWAHIDRRIDFDLLMKAADLRPSIKFYLVGPCADDMTPVLAKLKDGRNNVVILPSMKLDELPLQDFFAAIIPYKNNIKDIEAVTLSNKSFQLMGRGLPLVTHGMPHFFEHPAISKSHSLSGFLKGLDDASKIFLTQQFLIKGLIEKNGVESRYEQFSLVLSSL